MRATLILLTIAACAKERPRPVPEAPSGPGTAPPAPLQKCTITTELTPGIPGSPGHLIDSSRNPNGDSELAALMRQMMDDTAQARLRVLSGDPVGELIDTHRRILCTWPIDAATRNAHFDSMAKRYLETVETLERKSDTGAYHDLVRACIHCHENTCPGPTAAINKLQL